MRKILAATDLSERSGRALHRALTLAEECGADLEIIAVVDDDVASELLEHNTAQARKALDEQIKTLPPRRNVDLTSSILQGLDYVEIVKRSREAFADLIVLGNARHAAKGLFRGTTAERVIRLARSPALVVKKPCAAAYARIVVGIDLSVHSRRALEFAAAFAPQAEIYCVHASHEPFVAFLGDESRADLIREEQAEFSREFDAQLTEMAERLETSRSRFHTILKTGDPLSNLIASIEEVKADLIVTGTHGRTAIAQAVLGSVAEEVLAEAPVDVLVARAW